jgi:homoserine kinase
MGWYSLRVPASSANLGPGFDAVGMALGIYLECRFRKAERLAIRACGRDAACIPEDESNLVWKTAQEVAAKAGPGHTGLPLPPIELELANDIPIGKGLGSSAAALTAGVVIADRLLGLNWKALRILDEAARIEGHPDNVGACVLGSIVASAIDSGGVARAVRLDLPARFGVAVVVPDFDLPTVKARMVLPETYSRRDAVFNVQRSALLMAAMATGTISAFPAALEDRFHQPYRESLVPGLGDALRLRAPGLLGCTLSGAGPSILVFYERGYGEVCDLVRQIFALNGHAAEVLHTHVPEHGYTLAEEAD